MFEIADLALALCLFLGAVLYISVGHGGAWLISRSWRCWAFPLDHANKWAYADCASFGFTSTQVISARLAENWRSVGQLPATLPIYAATMLAGTLIGTAISIRVLPTQRRHKALGIFLMLVGMKMIGVY